jgi:four helix bundle protein
MSNSELLGFESLKVYQLSFKLAMEVFEISKTFPREEMYSLTDQVRRSSRSVCTNIGEGYRKRVYTKYFVAKLIDVDGECSETLIHLKFALNCRYINEENYSNFKLKYEEVGRMLGAMIREPEKFKPKENKTP